MEMLFLIGTVAALHLLAVASPGPDFVVVVRNTLSGSRRTGLWTSVGIGCGILVHVAYCLAGLAVVLSQSILLFNLLKFVAAGYLVFLGCRALCSKRSQIQVESIAGKKILSAKKAFQIGFLTNALNPKATLFFLGLFTLVITPDTPFWVQLVMSGIVFFDTIAWFSLVTLFFSHRAIRSTFLQWGHWFERFFGALLIAFGLKIATATVKE